MERKNICSQCHSEVTELWAYKLLHLCKECYMAIRPEEFDENGNWISDVTSDEP